MNVGCTNETEDINNLNMHTILKRGQFCLLSFNNIKRFFLERKHLSSTPICSIFFQKLYLSISPSMVWTAYHTDYYCCETRDPQQSTNYYCNDNTNS